MQLRARSFPRFGFRPPMLLERLRYQLTEEHRLTHDHEVIERLTPVDSDFRDLSFTFAVIALCAKVASAEGAISREKYLAYRDAFPLSGLLCGKLRRLFWLACRNSTPYEHYTTQIRHMFAGRRDVLHSLMERLLAIGGAEGDISRETGLLLARIGRSLGLSAQEYAELLEKQRMRRAHHVLGVEKSTPARQVKKRYHALMRRFHPDRFAQQQLSPELTLLLQLKSSEISQAYALLSKKAA